MPAQGRPYTDRKDELGSAIRDFNEAIRNDDRVEVIGTPFRDGVSIIMRKCGCVNTINVNFMPSSVIVLHIALALLLW